MKRILGTFVTLARGWKTYMKYDVAFAGLGLAFLFMTVLGFDNITVGRYPRYF
jgi:iron-regulated transporter 1